jgi:hypothetical protein
VFAKLRFFVSSKRWVVSEIPMYRQLTRRKPKMKIDRQLSIGFVHAWEVVLDYAPGEDNQTCNPGNKHDH